MVEKQKKAFNCVLVIDDEEINLLITRLLLEKIQVAEQIVTVSQVKEGIAFIERHCMNEHASKNDCPDLILHDLNMPLMDGFSFLEALQALGQSNLVHTVVVVLTSSLHERDQQRIAAYGVRAYLSKPITIEKIHYLIELLT